MASPTPSRHSEGDDALKEASNPAPEPSDISVPTSNGQEQDVTENDTSQPVTENSQGGAKPVSDGDRHSSTGEISPSSSPPESVASSQANVNDRLIDAASNGDLVALKEAISSEADITATGSEEETALHKACREGHDDIVEELLKHKKISYCLKQLDEDDWTPLISACFNNASGTKRIVQMLLQEYAKLDEVKKFGINYISDKKKRSALIMACLESSEEVVRLLLEEKPEVNVADHRGYTPLTLACRHFSAEVVQLMLEAKAEVDAVDEDGNTPLILASQYGDSKMVAKILEYSPKTIKNKNEFGEDAMGGDTFGSDALGSAIVNLKARDQIIPLLLNRGLQLSHEDARKLFSHGTSETALGSDSQQSMWLKVVQNMLKFNNSPHDITLQKAIKLLLEFASKQEKVSAILNADTKDHFEFLCGLTEDLGLSKTLCTSIWLSDRGGGGKLQVDPSVEALVEKLSSLSSTTDKSKPPQITKLQLSAFYGDYTLVWYLLKQSQSVDKDDISKALEIAKAQKPTRRTKVKKNTVESKNEREGKADLKDKHRDEDSKKPEVDEDSKRYDLTIDALNNAPTLVTIPAKQPNRPDSKDIKEKTSLLLQRSATIVNFYKRDEQIDLLRSSPSVFDLVYGSDGDQLNTVMETARSTFDEMTSTTFNKDMPKQKLQLRWIHLPANNMDWMEHLTLRIYDEKQLGDKKQPGDQKQPGDEEQPGEDEELGDEGKLGIDKEPTETESLTSFMDLAQRSQNELPTDKSNIKFMKPICLRELDGLVPRLALYTPYVTFGYCYTEAAKALNQKHAELIEKYNGRILHGPRSLDRFYYNALLPTEMDERDMTQVVTRGLLKMAIGDSIPRVYAKWPYLTVDQLWVWVIDDETIVTSSTHREDEFDNLLVEKVWENLLQASQDGFREKLPSEVTEMSQFLVSTCVDFINNLTWEGVCGKNDKRVSGDARLKPILSWYADSINDVAAQEKNLFKAFKNRTAEAEAEVEADLKAAEANRDPALQSARNSSLTNLRKDKKDWEAIHNAARLLDEVKDIRDELVILQSLVNQQGRVWAGLMGPDPDSHDARSPSFIALELDAMIQMTDTIQESIKNLLNLEENSIDIKESMMSRDLVNQSTKQGKDLVSLAKTSKDQNDNLLELAGIARTQSGHLVELADKANKQSNDNAKQEKILFVFTIVTVIFTPLSFMTSILALNTTTTRHNDDGELEWEPSLMYGIIFGTSAGFFVLVLVYAFFGDILREKVHKMRHGKSQSTGKTTSATEGSSSTGRCTRDIETGNAETTNTQQASLAAQLRKS